MRIFYLFYASVFVFDDTLIPSWIMINDMGGNGVSTMYNTSHDIVFYIASYSYSRKMNGGHVR